MKNDLSTEKRSIEKKYKNKLMQENNIKSNKRLKLFVIILLIFNVIFLIGIAFLVYCYITSLKNINKINKEKEIFSNNENSLNNEKIKNKNSIDAIYKTETGKTISLFNPEEINLKEENYLVEAEDIKNKNNLRNLRNLRSIVVEKGKYTPTESGYLSITIIFNVNLNTLNSFFKNNQEIIKVNITNLEMNEVTDMISTFSGCTKLNEIILDGINTSNLVNMEYTFENCIELKKLNLSPIKTTSNLIKMNSIFNGCNKLEVINISSFETIDENIFKGLNKKPDIIANQYIANNIINIFYNLYNININITIIEYNKKENKNNLCNLGENEKCKTCSKVIPENCFTCNDGYYLPLNEINNTICLSCDKIENCLTCFGDKRNIICSSCNLGFNLENNICIKAIEAPLCVIGEKEKCRTCKDNKQLQNECQTCNEGYFLPNKESQIICQKCDIIEGCEKCLENNQNMIICLECKNGYELLNGSCHEEECIIGENEKCASCKNEKGRKKECYSCNDGYFVSNYNINSTNCSRCLINHCKKCTIEKGKEICLECFESFTSKKNGDNYIESCICPSGHKVINNSICQKIENWIEIIHNYSTGYLDDHIINVEFADIQINEMDIYINDTLVNVEILNEYSAHPARYPFKKGIYKIKINIKKVLTSMEWLFTNCYGIKSLSFLPGFDSSKVTSMRLMFSCTHIEYLDMKYLDTSSLRDLNEFIRTPQNMLCWRNNVKIIDLSSFNTSKVTNCIGLIHEICEDTIIKISNKFTKCREFIPLGNPIINIDDIICKQKFGNCEKCNGSQETLYCSKCKIGFKLYNNSCIKQICIIGDNEKCSDCEIIKGKENQCSSCNEGYYLPINIADKSKCTKCLTDGCKTCNSITGDCNECKIYHEPIINDGIISLCKLTCEIGNEDKCLSCNLNKCSNCNPGYKLMNNGTCKKIENSFVGIYNITSTNYPVRIMSLLYKNITLSDFDIYFNNKKIFPEIINYNVLYTFQTIGMKEVKIIFNKTLFSMDSLFNYCTNLISINFNEAFDTSKINCMGNMFYGCDSLISVNLSSFNTSLVTDFNYLFYNCNKITSLNLSNFEGTNSYYISNIFYYNQNLKFIDFSSFYSPYSYDSILQSNVKNGTIIVNRKLYLGNAFQNWNVIYKDL